jgi:hydroxypyruvate isomerase
MKRDGSRGLRFAANLGMLFAERAFLDRFAAASAAGFEAVEFPRLYGADLDAVDAALRSEGVSLVQFSLPRGNLGRGERGFANDPRRQQEFRDSLAWTLDVVGRLGCNRVTCPAGNCLADVALSLQWGTLADSLHYASDRAARMGVTILIEPLNRFDHPGVLLNTMAEARKLIAHVKHENLRILCDVYHMQRAEGNLTQTILEHLPLIDHVQIADSPGRHQPGTGEINYRFILRELVEARFDGWVALEYQPLGSTVDSLAWLSEYVTGVPANSKQGTGAYNHVSRL